MIKCELVSGDAVKKSGCGQRVTGIIPAIAALKAPSLKIWIFFWPGLVVVSLTGISL